MATELIGHHAVERHREKPRRHCARCGGFVRHGDDHLRVQMHGATSLFHWRCFHRDHATILYACQQMERRMAGDFAFGQFIEKLEGQIISAATAMEAAA